MESMLRCPGCLHTHANMRLSHMRNPNDPLAFIMNHCAIVSALQRISIATHWHEIELWLGATKSNRLVTCQP